MRADDADDLRNRAEEILSRPQFREPEPSLLDRFFGWLGEQLDRILSPVFDALGLGGVGGGMAWLLLVVIAAVVAVVVVVIVVALHDVVAFVDGVVAVVRVAVAVVAAVVERLGEPISGACIVVGQRRRR